MDEPVGRHDGTVQGVRYFAATDNHGVFATEAKLSKVQSKLAKKMMINSKSLDILDSPDDSTPNSEMAVNSAATAAGDEKLTFSMNYHTLATNQEEPNSSPQSSKARPRRPLRRSLSAQHRAIKVVPKLLLQLHLYIFHSDYHICLFN